MGSSVLVTGGSRGIGRAIAVGLAGTGAEVVGIHYTRDEAAARQTAELVRQAGAAPVLVRAEFGTDGVAAAERLATTFLDQVEQTVGHRQIDVLVNNAGIGGPQQLGSIDEATYRRVVEVNLTVPIFLTQALWPHLRDGGRVINVSTGYTRIAAPTHPVYSATKAALNALTLALAPTLGARGVTVNAVMPGVIETDMNADWLDQGDARKEAAGLSVFNRVGDVDDVADVVRFLASEQSRWITGQVIDVTGGSAL
ncbi:SDR family NAD(P)-dependent oxidoreductase [Micromonospora sp. NPDC047730]|uniref:SDR family NAD(P)-dependent oxidoreductase n=1 Tax=Micromonospora sp. NPDC047730 TaxID=3364253 RepID=UPI003714A16B